MKSSAVSTDPAEASPSPSVHSAHIRRELTELIEHLEADVTRVDDPRFQSLLTTSAAVLRGVSAAFADFDERRAAQVNLQE